MDRRSFIVSSAAAGAVAPGAVQPPSLGQQILGAWILVEAAAVAGASVSPWAGRTNPVNGLIMYGADGWMSVHISGARPGEIGRAEYTQLPEPDKFHWLKEYYGYYGRFEVDEAERIVTHRVVDSLLPYERKMILKRRCELVGDRLTLNTEPRTEAGQTTFNRLVWKRA